MNKFRAIATGAVVALCLVGAGHFGTAPDERVALVTSSGTAAAFTALDATVSSAIAVLKHFVAGLVAL